MKKNSLLLIATTLLLTVANAAERETSSGAMSLPTYVVEAERISPAERLVHQSLNTLRDLARTPITVSVELPALKSSIDRNAQAVASTRLAKF